ncbi:M28 family metallopeptidase [Methanobacterium sp.]|uniref:M28 family metallopeptidase n=1 Tax=Methanobacterium sp. TaxID=2164 RepID=UPI003C74EB93
MKNKNIFLIAGIALCVVVLTGAVLFNSSNKSDQFQLSVIDPLNKAKEFDSQNALDFSKTICSLGPRYGGNDAELKAADKMEAEFKANGVNAYKEKVDLGNGKYTYNVIGEIKGSETAEKYIIIGSHTDSPGFCEGATDDAAAMGIQTEMARILSTGYKPKQTVLIVGFGGEEMWFKGSDAFVKSHPDIVKNCEAMIDLNCVGAGEQVSLIGHSNQPQPVNGDPKLIGLMKNCAKQLGYPATTGTTTYPSDTYPFYYSSTKVPVLQVMSQPFEVAPWSSANTFDKLNSKDMAKIGQTVTMTVLNLTV